jgi:hypothetical protein
MSDNHLPDELHDVESALRSLTPQPTRIDPVRLMYLAGQESVRAASRREGRVSGWWRVAGTLSSALALTLAAVIVARPQPEPVVVYRDVLAPATSQPADSDTAPPPPPTAIAAQSGPEPSADVQAPLVADWLPIGGFRQRQLAMLQNTDGVSLAAVSGGGCRSIPQRELLDQCLRDSGVEHTALPRAAAVFPWTFLQTGVP